MNRWECLVSPQSEINRLSPNRDTCFSMSFAAAPSVRRSCRKRMGAPPHPDMNATLPPVGGAEPVLLPPTDLHSLFRRIGALVRRYIVPFADLRGQAGRAYLLALPTDAHPRLPAEISRGDHEPTRASRGRPDRLGPALGHSVPLQDRLLHDLHRGDVVAQSRQSLDGSPASL